jgi:nitrite reductase/ring-hydroxylating ferredoxin subunit
MPEINRRQLLATLATATAAACALAGGCANAGRAAWTGPMDFDLGPASQFDKPGIDARWATSGGFFVVREGPRVFCVSSICTHQACPLKPAAPDLQCPCHGSRFTEQGKVLNGPATASLVHFGVTLSATGNVLVDRRKTYDEQRWHDAGSFVTV